VSRALTDSPSDGRSEVLTALHRSAGGRPLRVARLVRAVARRFGLPERDESVADDVLTVLGDLETEGLVTEATDLDDDVALTGAGRVAARAARPRARNIRG